MYMYATDSNSIRRTNQLHSHNPTHSVYVVKGSVLHSFIYAQDPLLWTDLGFEYYALDPRLYTMLSLLVQ
jgi:sucrose-6-phosphate hydrolase SacC (GH32 family)